MQFHSKIRVLLLGLLAASSPASAQEILEQGVLQGDLQSSYDCYMVDLPAGSAWEVAMDFAVFDTFLVVGRGESCDAMQVDLQNDDGGSGYNARSRFIASGGAYLIAARGYAAAATGAYTISLAPSTRGGRKLPPGATMPAFLTDTSSLSASTAPPDKPDQYPARTEFQDCADICPKMVVVKAGSFMMGSSGSEEGRESDEGPQRLVTFANNYAIGKFEVTFDEWNACVKDNACPVKTEDGGWGTGKRPVIAVTWFDANRYVEWLSKKTSARYFLPSEAEWEHAARAGTQTPWNTGNAIVGDDANILNQFGRTVPVGGFPANAWGVHDAHGNVGEWVRDCYDIGYFGVPSDGGAMVTPKCKLRAIRGMAFDRAPSEVRSANRSRSKPNAKYLGIGFRVARAL